ncbi:hypothetical protein PAECIP111893_00558 [Paenibacillus plantiphilus]|uniref:Uncharacterized protein n=1 Tax=Paenibacillus plantiphilus TaxID=2905650 RepID=A0ABN8FX74_9BACL|nr:hypothetical protein [Paenibacillus plantiphilus]CAH1193805.1 hypothetical protein PAECIP111893_00558 [Paenibacillus plantiphilus]
MFTALERDLLKEVLYLKFPQASDQQLEASIMEGQTIVANAANNTTSSVSQERFSYVPTHSPNSWAGTPVLPIEHEGWKGSIGGGGSFGIPGLAGGSFSGGISYENSFIKPLCKTAAEAIYNAATLAANAIPNPIAQIAARVAAKSVYDEAKKRC